MLKNSTHQKKPVHEANRTSKFVLTDEHVVLYIQAFFKVSPRCATGAAPASEWLEFLELFNEREGHYILTDQEMEAIRPYCQINAQVEMTPEDFIQLIHLIRHGHRQPTNPPPPPPPQPQQQQPPVVSHSQQQYQRHEEQEHEEITPQMSVSTKHLFDSRPRSNKLISKNYYRSQKSPNHPISDDDFSASSRKSEFSNDDFSNYHQAIYPEFEPRNVVEALKKDKLEASKQIREYESRIQNLISEHSTRITQLQTNWENLSIETNHLKSLIAVQKNKERERLDKISELQGVIAESDIKLSNALKKQQSKDQQIDIYKEKLLQLESQMHTTNQDLTDISHRLSQEQEIVRVLQLEKTKNQQALEDERQIVLGLKENLQDQETEHQTLLDLVEKQKVELHELGLKSRMNTPVVGLNAEASLAHEKAEAEIKDYQDKITSLELELKENEQKINEYEEQMRKDEEMMKSYIEQDNVMNKLKTDFNIQHQKMTNIESLVTSKDKKLKNRRFTQCMNLLSYAFLLYHIVLIVLNLSVYGHSEHVRINPLFGLLERLDDWYTM